MLRIKQWHNGWRENAAGRLVEIISVHADNIGVLRFSLPAFVNLSVDILIGWWGFDTGGSKITWIKKIEFHFYSKYVYCAE